MAPMANYTAKRIDEMEAAHGGGMVKARAELGVTSFGMQVMQLPPDYPDYPLHDHVADGQEEVYMAIGGSGWIEVDGERIELGDDTLVRVAPEAKRKLFSGPEGLRVLALGGTPDQAYEVSPFSMLEGEA
jgi:mannose-6-phosphate isomerase-like protein (cupin superfamily)